MHGRYFEGSRLSIQVSPGLSRSLTYKDLILVSVGEEATLDRLAL